ncbi:hypothetical protein AWB69_08125 [Caballeronia udeis]|uniref:Uncharacterized protein n=1 Tax=Caballeronia udeis TaxID=1232866 RepID=A0A158JKN5_9BURK|nr:hypothetical protein AWB69_08125 [Caballeronia udeis]
MRRGIVYLSAEPRFQLFNSALFDSLLNRQL